MKNNRLLLLVFSVLLMPILLIAQQNQNAMNAMEANGDIISQLAHLLPMGINPYATIFLTSILSKLEIHNDFVATNPFFDNWIILILFGVLFLFTASVGTIFKTNKVTAVIGLADNYLSNHAAILINIVVMIAPVLFTNSNQEVMQEASFLSIGLKTLLIIIVSIYFLLVVTSVRFFIDILIFLTPIPFIDSILEIVKITLTALFIVLSVFFPTLSVILSGVIFIVALSMYKKSLRLVSKTTYLFIYPILNLFKSSETLLVKNNRFSVIVYLNEKTTYLKKGTIARIEEREDGFYLAQKRFFIAKKEEKITFEENDILSGGLKSTIKDNLGQREFFLNRSYQKYQDEIIIKLGLEDKTQKEEKKLEDSNKGFLVKIKSMFDKEAVKELKMID